MTVSVKPLCYNGPENMKFAIQNPKWEGRICQIRLLHYLPLTENTEALSFFNDGIFISLRSLWTLREI